MAGKRYLHGEQWNADAANRLGSIAGETTEDWGLGGNVGDKSIQRYEPVYPTSPPLYKPLYYKAEGSWNQGNPHPTVEVHPCEGPDGANEDTSITETATLIRNGAANLGTASEAQATQPNVQDDDVIVCVRGEDGTLLGIAYSEDAAIGAMRMVVADPAAQIGPGWAEMDGSANSGGSGFDFVSEVAAGGENVGRYLMLRGTAGSGTGTGGITSHDHEAGTLAVDSHKHDSGTLEGDSHDHTIPTLSHTVSTVEVKGAVGGYPVVDTVYDHTGYTTGKNNVYISGKTGTAAPGVSGTTAATEYVPRFAAVIPIERVG